MIKQQFIWVLCSCVFIDSSSCLVLFNKNITNMNKNSKVRKIDLFFELSLYAVKARTETTTN